MPGGDDLVMHVTIRIGEAMIMASDGPGDRYGRPHGFSVWVAPSSLAVDAEAVAIPPASTFCAERFTMFINRFSTPWMPSYEGEKAEG